MKSEKGGGLLSFLETIAFGHYASLFEKQEILYSDVE